MYHAGARRNHRDEKGRPQRVRPAPPSSVRYGPTMRPSTTGPTGVVRPDGVAKLATGRVSPDELEGLVVGLLVLLAVAFNELRTGSGLRRPFFEGKLGIANIGILAALTGIITALLTAENKVFNGVAAAGVVLGLLGVKKVLEVRAAKRG